MYGGVVSMSSDHTAPESRGSALGALSVVMGLVACAGVTATWLVSTPAFDMPGWLRIVSGWAFPVGVLAALVLGVAARMRRSGAGLSIAGFVLAAVSVIEFGVMIAANPY